MPHDLVATFVIVFGLASAIGYVLGARVGARVARRAEQATIAELTAELRRVNAEAESMGALAKAEYDKRIEVVNTIAVAEQQRNHWHELFMSASLSYSATQALMMRERSQLVTQIRALGKKPKVNPAVERGVMQFDEKFVAPISPEDRERISARPSGDATRPPPVSADPLAGVIGESAGLTTTAKG